MIPKDWDLFFFYFSFSLSLLFFFLETSSLKVLSFFFSLSLSLKNLPRKSSLSFTSQQPSEHEIVFRRKCGEYRFPCAGPGLKPGWYCPIDWLRL